MELYYEKRQFQGTTMDGARAAKIEWMGGFVRSHLDYSSVYEPCERPVPVGHKCAVCSLPAEHTDLYPNGTLLESRAARSMVELVGANCPFSHACHAECIAAAVVDRTTSDSGMCMGSGQCTINPMAISAEKLAKLAELNEADAKWVVRREVFGEGCAFCKTLFPNGYGAWEEDMRREGFQDPRALVPLMRMGSSALFPDGGTIIVRNTFARGDSDTLTAQATPGTLIDFDGYRATDLCFLNRNRELIRLEEDSTQAGYAFVPQELVALRGLPYLMTHSHFSRSLGEYDLGGVVLTSEGLLLEPGQHRQAEVSLIDKENVMRSFWHNTLLPAKEEGRGNWMWANVADTSIDDMGKCCKDDGVFRWTEAMDGIRNKIRQSDRLKVSLPDFKSLVDGIIRANVDISALDSRDFPLACGSPGQPVATHPFLFRYGPPMPASVTAYIANPSVLERLGGRARCAQILSCSNLYMAFCIENAPSCSQWVVMGDFDCSNCQPSHDARLSEEDRSRLERSESEAVEMFKEVPVTAGESEEICDEFNRALAANSFPEEVRAFCNECGCRSQRHAVFGHYERAVEFVEGEAMFARMRSEQGGGEGFFSDFSDDDGGGGGFFSDFSDDDDGGDDNGVDFEI